MKYSPCDVKAVREKMRTGHEADRMRWKRVLEIIEAGFELEEVYDGLRVANVVVFAIEKRKFRRTRNANWHDYNDIHEVVYGALDG